ncbi:enoyl-[acyl-carrier-protein] reductase FabK [Hippea maritima]|uniref:Enoyl-(Acyl-carrier-protein) reductase II n=1 Tax=Hippea maritima (strain ATCC 700847 / DSM 10411 / MH2) TaxID=760142 RepID=F2LWZ2_HIPMA|nr:enoyl-[acyl-carrier-protein] reductase FabK [Hippea maritima]AEA34176.1 enoyl-(acyl-carrier-protein) reductase II [Hippea maritima DSM 10411]
MFRTEICDLLGIEYPIIQGGMAWVSDAVLAAAVSEAGGLGIIAAGNAPADWVENEIIKAKELTEKPFGVNIMLLSPYVDDVVDVVVRHEVKVITTGAGSPGKYMDRFKSIGAKVIPVVASVALAKRMEDTGADAVIAEGMESGGHIGELTTMALVPQVVDAVKIPVIAAGGIADGRGFVAALALGAKGVQMGTRFVASVECTISEAYKEVVVKAKDRDTVITGRATGHPVRIIKNKLAREFLKLEGNGATPEELEKFGEGRLRLAAREGDVKNGSVMAGQISGLISDIKPVNEIIKEIVDEAKNVVANINELLGA